MDSNWSIGPVPSASTLSRTSFPPPDSAPSRRSCALLLKTAPRMFTPCGITPDLMGISSPQLDVPVYTERPEEPEIEGLAGRYGRERSALPHYLTGVFLGLSEFRKRPSFHMRIHRDSTKRATHLRGVCHGLSTEGQSEGIAQYRGAAKV